MTDKQITKIDLQNIFVEIDRTLTQKEEEPLRVVVLGAASLLLLDIRERGTSDLDVAAAWDAERFRKIAKELKFEVDLVSVSTTVDFNAAEKYEVFKGKKLVVYSVNERDLIKLKLERFRKQDPADIDVIIKKLNLKYSDYKQIVLEAAGDYVGNPRRLALAILQVAEDHFERRQVEDLEKSLSNIL